MTTLDKSVWENRTTTRLFSETDNIIPDEDVKYLQTVINNIPSQCSIKSNFHLYLGQSKEDMKIRQWLADNIYWTPQYEDDNEDMIKETMLGIIQAPSIITCVRTSTPWANPEEEKTVADQIHLADRSEGLHAGVLLSTLLNMGYKVATFGCTAGVSSLGKETKQSLLDEYTNIIRERYGKELQEMIDTFPGKKGNWDDIHFFPGITQCFGKEAIDNKKRFEGEYDTWTSPNGKEYKFINGSKVRTPVDTCVGF